MEAKTNGGFHFKYSTRPAEGLDEVLLTVA